MFGVLIGFELKDTIEIFGTVDRGLLCLIGLSVVMFNTKSLGRSVIVSVLFPLLSVIFWHNLSAPSSYILIALALCLLGFALDYYSKRLNA